MLVYILIGMWILSMCACIGSIIYYCYCNYKANKMINNIISMHKAVDEALLKNGITTENNNCEQTES